MPTVDLWLWLFTEQSWLSIKTDETGSPVWLHTKRLAYLFAAMSDSVRNVMRGGWHPKGKEGGKESWRGDFKGINQVV